MKNSRRYYPITCTEELPVLFDVPMAARLLGKCPDSIRKMAAAGELPAHRIGKEWRFFRDEFMNFLMTQ